MPVEQVWKFLKVCVQLWVMKKNSLLVCPPPEQLEPIRRWHDELEGSNKILAFELMNQVMEGKITNEAALALLENKHG